MLFLLLACAENPGIKSQIEPIFPADGSVVSAQNLNLRGFHFELRGWQVGRGFNAPPEIGYVHHLSGDADPLAEDPENTDTTIPAAKLSINEASSNGLSPVPVLAFVLWDEYDQELDYVLLPEEVAFEGTLTNLISGSARIDATWIDTKGLRGNDAYPGYNDVELKSTVTVVEGRQYCWTIWNFGYNGSQSPTSIAPQCFKVK